MLKRAPQHALLGLALAAGAIGLTTVPAAAAVTVSVSPALVEVDASPGGQGSARIRLTNRGDIAIELAVEVGPYAEMEGRFAATDWLSVHPSVIPLDPGASAQAAVEIAIPEEIQSGGRYASIVFTIQPAGAAEEEMPLSGRVIVPVVMTIDGTGPLTAHPIVEHFAPILGPDGRVGFSAQVADDGNVHTQIGGVVRVDDLETSTSQSLTVSPTGILPGSTRLVSTADTLTLAADHRYAASVTFAAADGKQEFDPIDQHVDFGLEPRLSIASASVCSDPTAGLALATVIKNEADIGVEPGVHFEVSNDTGDRVIAGAPAARTLSWPHEAMTASMPLPEGLPPGAYSLRVVVDAAGQAPVEWQTPFSVEGDGEPEAAACLPGSSTDGA